MAHRSDAIDGAPIVRSCLDLGFSTAGVCDAQPSASATQYREWIADGRHGSMEYLERNVEKRLDPSELMSGARSIIMVTDQYAVRGESANGESQAGGARVARYARGRDYHKEMKKRLHALCDMLRETYAGHEFRAFVDTAPVLEREHAARAGLGWIGKHTLLIDPRRGSYLFLGGVLTTLKIETPTEQVAVDDHCGGCTRCIDACPTSAITPYSVDARACISYLTIENRGDIDPRYFEAIGDWIFGCDICQEVCPHNSPRDDHLDVGVRNGAYEPVNSRFDLLEVLGWDESARRDALRASAMKRAKLDMLRRNATIAAANALQRGENTALRSRLQELRTDDAETPLTSAVARQMADGT